MLHPGETARSAVRHAVPEGCTRRARRGVRLPEGAARLHRAVAAGPLFSLGTDGFGRSESRAALRDFFEVDAKHIVLATLTALARENKIKPEDLKRAVRDLNINPDKLNPVNS